MPPSTTDIEKRQRDISAQAAQWLTEATPGKQNRPGTTEMMDMAEYAAQSAKRRKEKIAAGADLATAVRSARQLADLLKELDCVRSDDTLATAIGSSIDFLTPNAINDCFYICRERNRIVHESSAGDELRDVQRFRSAVQRARREIQVQIDIQNSYKTPTAAPVPPPPPSPSVVSSSSLATSPPTTSSVSTPSPVVNSPTTSVWKTRTTFAKRLTSSVISKTPSLFKKSLPSSVSPSTISTSSSAGSLSTISSASKPSPGVMHPLVSSAASTPSPDVRHLPAMVPSSAAPTPSAVVKRQPATVSPAAPTPSPGVTHPPAFLAYFDRGLRHFHKGEYSLVIATLTAFTRQVDGKEYSDRLAVAKSTIEMAQSRPKALKEADNAFRDENIFEAFSLYNILRGEVQFEEDCYAMVMFRMGICCTAKTGLPCFSNTLRKEPGNGIFIRHRALAYMELDDFKSAKVDLESIDLATVDATLAREIAEDLEICRPKADPMCRRGHLEEDEIDDLIKRFGLED